MSTTIDNWSDFFPPTTEGVRPDQEKAINFILDRIKDGVTNVFLEAPTGVGKSFLAWTVAQYCAAELNWRTRILVPNLYLQDQYCRDFSRLGMLRLESARHYECDEFDTCDVGRGSEIVQPAPGPIVVVEDSSEQSKLLAATVSLQASCQVKCTNPNCSYVEARVAFTKCPVGVSNTAYALTCARFGHPFVSGDFLIIDEAHNLADEISSLYEITVDCSAFQDAPERGQEFVWLKAFYLPILTERIRGLRTAVDRPGISAAEVAKLSARLSRCTNEAVNIAFITRTPPDEWVISRPGGDIKVQPLWASRVAPMLLKFLAPRRLFMSGTFLDYNHHIASLGL